MSRTTKGIKRLSRFVARLATGAGSATLRFPVAALSIVAVAALANAAVAGMHPVSEADLPWLFAALWSAAASSIVARLFCESHGRGAFVSAVLPVAVALFFGLAVWNAPGLAGHVAPLIVALTLAVPLAPFVGRPSDERFWSFTVWTLVGVTLAFVSVLLFTLGVSAILEMVRFLLGVGIDSRAYEHIYTTALTLIGPLFALGRIPRDFDDEVSLAPGDRMAAGMRLLFGAVVAPLALATGLVLHLYAAKILILGALPQNEIGWIVTFFAVLVLVARVVAQPFLISGGISTRLFARAWALMLVVPLVLLVLGISLRISTEGVTLQRYFVALGAIVTVLVLVLQLVPRLRGDVRLLAGLPLLALALSSFGPWGVSATVGRSQTERIKAELGGQVPVVMAGLGASTRTAIRSRLYALEEADALNRMTPLLSPTDRAAFEAARAVGRPGLDGEVLTALGLNDIPPAPTEIAYSAKTAPVLDSAGFDLVVGWRAIDSGPPQPGGRPGLSFSGNDLVVDVGQTKARFAMTVLVEDLGRRAPGFDARPIVADFTDGEGRRLRLNLSSLTLSLPDRRIVAANAMILLRRTDWPGAAVLLGGDR